jgi:hypothetical protein
MKEGERQNRNLEKNFTEKFSDVLPDDSNVLEPSRIRYHSISTDSNDWECLVRQSRFILCSGIFFWSLFLLSKVI